MLDLKHDLELVKTSSFFDAAWYLAEYVDVAKLGIDPAEHYLRLGARLLRNPSARFDTAYYLRSNPDVAAHGMNPLVHFLRHGMKEGRPPLPYSRPVQQYAEAVDIVVPVFNALEDTQRCLESIRTRKDGFAVRVIVVNDGSDEPTSVWLKQYCAGHRMFDLVEHDTNRGYTKAVNTGLNAATAPYVITLNSDTVVTTGWLKGLVRCANSDPAIGIVGPLSNAASWQSVPRLLDASGQFAINRLPEGVAPDAMAGIVATVSERAYPRVPFVNGFCFLIKRTVIETIGIMDDVHFPIGYGEENDYCIRAAQAGFGLAIADDTYVYHAKSKSFGHAKRVELSKQGNDALKRKHTSEKLDALLAQVKNNGKLTLVRDAVADALKGWGKDAVDLLSMRILFLLPAAGGGGGSHSVVQEAAEMRRLGTQVHVGVMHDMVAQFRTLYQDIRGAADLFVGFGEADLIRLAGGYDIVVATLFNSVTLLKQVIDAHPHILPAYYVQDYEPFFFAPDSPLWKMARASYSLIPDAVLFAKTHWIANKVVAEHHVRVRKVEPSIDHDLYRPAAKANDGRIHIVAMVRPQTPRRGAERTMRVLSALAKARPDTHAFSIFGCDGKAEEFSSLRTDFVFRNHGVLTRPQVAALLSTADIFVDLSDYQAFGRTALEAMASGCATMVPLYGGADEFAIDGVNAMVVETDDEAQCTQRLIAQTDDLAGLRRMQMAALRTAARYSIHAAAVSELHMFAQALATRELPRPKPKLELVKPHVPMALPDRGKLPLTALVITWDVGHNPLGRSYMLAEVIDRVVRNVVTIGFQFPRYGTDVWEPVREGRLPVISLPGENFPELLDTFERIAGRIRPDVVIACKPRLPSVELAALIKDKFGCPMILDIDDHELSFFKDARELTLDDLRAMKNGEAASEVEPYTALWTRLAQHMRKYADSIIVSNVALHDEFGGTIVPHVRDETVFDPALYSRAASRQKYGVPEDARVVLFFGTPRHHKGINVLAEAVRQIDNPAFKLVIVGSSTDKSVTAKLDQLAPGRIIHLPNQPFSAIPEIMMIADIVCLPQDEDNPISKFQLPAKAIDAIAMGIPLLVTRTQPLMQLVRDGVAIAIDVDGLARVIEENASEDAIRQRWAARTRPAFLEKYSYAASAAAMRKVIVQALRDNDRARTDDLRVLIDQQRRVLGLPGPAGMAPAPSGVDIVVFWKQNDTGMYGRRSDMVIKYLASRDDVRRVIVFDAPMSEHDLLNRRNKTGKATQDRLLYVKTYEKVLGKMDTDKTSYHVFTYPPGVYRSTDDGSNRPHLQEAYLAYLAGVFEQYGVTPSESIFWLYPKNYMAPAIVDHFDPLKVVVDVVDDHRAWPGISVEERDRLTDNYRETLQRADMAFANCEPVVESMREFFPSIRLVPNGCDLRPPQEQPRNNADFNEFVAWKGKTIGFVGNLEQKIDIDLIAKVAERFSDCQVVLVGSTHANPDVLRLKQYPNVRMPGVVPYGQVGAWLSRFDVGMIPHRDMDLTRSMNPLKLYVYLAWNIPVVSTEIFNVDNSSRLVQMSSTHEEFMSSIGKALAMGKVDDPALREYVVANSWETRLTQQVDQLIDQCVEKASWSQLEKKAS